MPKKIEEAAFLFEDCFNLFYIRTKAPVAGDTSVTFRLRKFEPLLDCLTWIQS